MDFSIGNSGAMLDPTAFPGSPADCYWSGTAGAQTGTHWSVQFSTLGLAGANKDSLNCYTRCVRDEMTTAGPKPPVGTMSASGGVIVDAYTNLTWQPDYIDANKFADAVTGCANLSLAGGGWRVPSIKELMTTVDASKQYPAIDDALFPGAYSSNDRYWSTTANADYPTMRETVLFYDGHIINSQPTTVGGHVRCVR